MIEKLYVGSDDSGAERTFIAVVDSELTFY